MDRVPTAANTCEKFRHGRRVHKLCRAPRNRPATNDGVGDGTASTVQRSQSITVDHIGGTFLCQPIKRMAVELRCGNKVDEPNRAGAREDYCGAWRPKR